MVLLRDEAQVEACFGPLGDIADTDRCTVCAKHTIGLEIVWMHPMQLLGEWVMSNLVLIRLDMVLVSVQVRCTVCAKHTIGLEIVLDAPDGTPK